MRAILEIPIANTTRPRKSFAKLDALDGSFGGTIRVRFNKSNVPTQSWARVGEPFVTSGACLPVAGHRASYLFARGCIRPTTECALACVCKVETRR